MELFPVEGPWPGRLAICLRPRSGTWLEDDIRALRAAGHDVLVSALTPEEIVSLELGPVPEACSRHGLEFVNVPVGNLQVPNLDTVLPHVQSWYAHLSAGRGVAVHCWASVGRSPTLVAATLAFAGIPVEEAWARIELSRGRQVPDTLEQRRWVEQFFAHR
ncbi:MAG: tyrosine protein phosphatase [Dehalococcoidia bacterium]|nr:tyrosine protein phosphatase [Dehalococcoidia bacterium]